jgi:hypothetical protein
MENTAAATALHHWPSPPVITSAPHRRLLNLNQSHGGIELLHQGLRWSVTYALLFLPLPLVVNVLRHVYPVYKKSTPARSTHSDPFFYQYRLINHIWLLNNSYPWIIRMTEIMGFQSIILSPHSLYNSRSKDELMLKTHELHRIVSPLLPSPTLTICTPN